MVVMVMVVVMVVYYRHGERNDDCRSCFLQYW